MPGSAGLRNSDYRTKHPAGRFLRVSITLLAIQLILATTLASSCGEGPEKAEARSNKVVAVVIAATGEFQIQKAGTEMWMAGTPGASLYEGDTVQTGSGAKLTLSFTGGQQIQMNENTYIRVTSAPEEPPEMEMNRGEAWLEEGGEQEGTSFDTPAATASVEGTQLNIKVDPGGKTVLTVAEGRVDFSNDEGSVTVEDSQQSTADPGKAPTKPVFVELENIDSWVMGYRFYVEMQIDPYYPDQESRKSAEQRARSKLEKKPDDASAEVELGKALLDSSRASEAAEYFESALCTEESSVGALCGLGKIALVEARWEDAEGYYRMALDLDDETFEARYGMGQALMGQGETDKAGEWFKKAEKADPEDGRPWVALGLLKFIEEDLEGATGDFEKAVSVDPSLVRGYQALGTVYSLRRDTDAAIDFLEKALEKDPEDYRVLNTLGTIYLRQDRLDEAASCFEKLEESEELRIRADGYQNLGFVESCRGKHREAASMFQKALELDPESAFSWGGLGWARLLSEEHQGAVEAFSRAIELEPEYWLAHESLAVAYTMMGEVEKAAEAARRGIELNPADWLGHQVLGLTLLMSGDNQGAIEELKLARKYVPEKHLTAREYFLIGYTYELEGEYEKALGNYRRASENSPEEAGYHAAIASILSGQGKTEEARKEYEKTIELDPHNPVARSGLALIYYGEGNLEQAIRQMEAAVEANPEDVYSRYFLAQFLLDSGDAQSALQHLDEALALPAAAGEVRVSLLTLKGRVLDAMGDPSGAVEALRDALSLDGSAGDTWYYLGVALEETGDREGALEAYSKASELCAGTRGFEQLKKDADEKLEELR